MIDMHILSYIRYKDGDRIYESIDDNNEEIDLETDTVLLHGLGNSMISVVDNNKIFTEQCNICRGIDKKIDVNMELSELGKYSVEKYDDKDLNIISFFNQEKDVYEVRYVVQTTNDGLVVLEFKNDNTGNMNYFNYHDDKVYNIVMEFEYIGNPLNFIYKPTKIILPNGKLLNHKMIEEGQEYESYVAPIRIINNDIELTLKENDNYFSELSVSTLDDELHYTYSIFDQSQIKNES